MEVDFDSVDEISDYVSVPAGTYLCQVAEVRTGRTKHGDERWGLRLVVAEGEYAGRFAAWDGLVFSLRGRARLRRIFAALGLPTSGKVELAPKDIEGRRAFVEVRPVEYTNPGTGEVIRRNEVPFDGWTADPTRADGAAGRDGTARSGGTGGGTGGKAARRGKDADEIPF
jgi:hypothetical protein